MGKVLEKVCKVCGKTEPEVSFYKGNSSKCKKCKNKADGEARALKEGRIYTPRDTVDVPEGFKICTKCKELLPLSDFYILGKINKNGTNKIYSRCKKCETEIVKTHTNRSIYSKTSNENSAKRRKEDPEYRQHLNELNRAHYNREIGIITHMLTSAKKRAKKNKLEFNITKEDIILPTHCPILGTELVKGVKGDYLMTYSLDRIDNSLGYIKGNVQVISMLANSMKNAASGDQLEAFSKNIINYIQKDQDKN